MTLGGLPMAESEVVVDGMLYASVTDRCGDAIAVDATGLLRVPSAEIVFANTEQNYYHNFAQRAVFVVK